MISTQYKNCDNKTLELTEPAIENLNFKWEFQILTLIQTWSSCLGSATQLSVGKMKNIKHKTLIDNNGEFEWEYYFIGGKQKKRKVRPFEDYDFIEKNSDDLF